MLLRVSKHPRAEHARDDEEHRHDREARDRQAPREGAHHVDRAREAEDAREKEHDPEAKKHTDVADIARRSTHDFPGRCVPEERRTETLETIEERSPKSILGATTRREDHAARERPPDGGAEAYDDERDRSDLRVVRVEAARGVHGVAHEEVAPGDQQLLNEEQRATDEEPGELASEEAREADGEGGVRTGGAAHTREFLYHGDVDDEGAPGLEAVMTHPETRVLLVADDSEPFQALRLASSELGASWSECRCDAENVASAVTASGAPSVILLGATSREGAAAACDALRLPAAHILSVLLLPASHDGWASSLAERFALLCVPVPDGPQEAANVLASLITLARRLVSLVQATERWRTEVERVAMLASRIGHDIGTHFGVARTGVATILRLAKPLGVGTTPEADVARDILELAVLSSRNIERAEEIGAQFKRVAAAQARPEPALVDLVEVVADCVAMFAAEARTRGVSVRFHHDAPRIPWFGPAGDLVTVLANFFQNAFRHAFHVRRDGARIDVEASIRPDGRVRLSFADNGPGVPEALRVRLFEPFFTSAPDRGGTGLGLASCREIIEALGGRVDLSSKTDGAEFVVELAATAASAETRETTADNAGR